jgi:hypothetical protein
MDGMEDGMEIDEQRAGFGSDSKSSPIFHFGETSDLFDPFGSLAFEENLQIRMEFPVFSSSISG